MGMRDVSAKVNSLREARAEACLKVSPESIELIRTGHAPKGDPLPIARVAAIQAAKNTPQIIPYCHPVPVDCVTVDFELKENSIEVVVEVKAVYKTGVEMEALTAAAAAVLNLFDLLKPVDHDMEIQWIRLAKKTGGKTQFAHAESFRAAVIVVSDRVAAGTAEDRSGALLTTLLAAQGGDILSTTCVPDDVDLVADAVTTSANGVDMLFLTGGTGLSPRDRTPEAVLPLLSTRLDGIEHRLRTYSQDRLPTAMLGRPFAGLLGSTIVVGLPGSPGAVADAVAALFPYLKHALHIIRGGDHGD